MEETVQTHVSLKRALGLLTSTLLVVGLLIGSGVFKKIIPMAQTGLGEAAILMAWTVAGIITLFGVFTVSGLASLTSESGGMYEYLQIAFGKFVAFMSGWADFVIIGPGVIAALAYLFAQVIHSIIPVHDPLSSFAHISVAGFIFPFADSGVKIVAMLSIAVLTGINSLGVRESGVINNVVTGAKILGILILTVIGISYSETPTTVLGVPVRTISPGDGLPFLSAFLTAMLGAFWAYDGWAHAPNISGEIKDPKQNVPLALALGCFLVMVIYVLVNYAYMNVLPLPTLRLVGENEIGAVVVVTTLLGEYGRIFFMALLVISVFSCLNSYVIIVPRKYFRMAEEGYFFKPVKRVHTRFSTPYVSMLYTMVWSCVLVLSGSFEMLTDMTIFAGFIFYGMLAIAVVKLKRNGTIKVKVAGYPFTPIIFLMVSIALTINTIWVQPSQSLLGLLLILSGIPFYYYFRNRKTRMASNVQ
jgi:APA family basic amino acid/polyamine antiporter